MITIGHDHIRLPLKGFQIPYDRASEKIILRKFRLVQQNLCPFGPDPFHDALDTGLTEIIGAGLHDKPIDSYDHLLPRYTASTLTSLIKSRLLQNTVRDMILAGTVGGHDGLDQILGNVLIIGQ